MEKYYRYTSKGVGVMADTTTIPSEIKKQFWKNAKWLPRPRFEYNSKHISFFT
ncbi:MAG: hypothetical protein WCJ19_02200 [bacterium]